MHDIVGLCKNWNEFLDVNVLAMFGFFPNPLLMLHIEDDFHEHMMRHGFVIHSRYEDAASVTHHTQTSRHAGGQRRHHAATEARNWVAGQMSRNDERVRRFVKVMSIRPNHVCIYVRDMKIGKILVEPPED